MEVSRYFKRTIVRPIARMFEQIDQKKRLLDGRQPLPPDTARTLREKIMLEWTYNSNAIEGNTLTLQETRVVLEGITVGGKSLKEHFEAINHEKAILYVEDIVQKKEPLTERQIKNIHALILKNIDDKNAGIYRKENVLMAGAKHAPPDYLVVPDQMRDLIAWYDDEAKPLHPVERAAMLHTGFVKIHPFTDGNGRTARLLLNFELMKNGFPSIVIKKEDRLMYYESLDKSHTTGDHDDFIRPAAKFVEDMLDLYLNVIGKIV